MWTCGHSCRILVAAFSRTNTPGLFPKHCSTFSRSTRLYSQTSVFYESRHDPDDEELSGYRRPTVNWYPGHIAKAERQLSETLKAVDVVVEVRDARACKATSHPSVGEWCAGRPRIVVLTHVDQIPRASQHAWKKSYDTLGAERLDAMNVNAQVRNQALQAIGERTKYQTKEKTPKEASQHVISPVEDVLFVNAKQGQGIHALHRAIFKGGAHVQERRQRRGLKDRPLRVGIIGYPNVGKSALINRILGRRRARTANTPGVTRSLQWIRVRTDGAKTTKKKEYELLDSPGIIPANLVDQSDAILLAACNCIGDAAYDNQAVAAYLCEWIKTLHIMGKGDVTAPEWVEKFKTRYDVDPLEKLEGYYRTGEDILFQVADNTCRGSPEDASRKILQDFRTGRMGPICLQVAPESENDKGQLEVPLYQQSESGLEEERLSLVEKMQKQQEERAQAALEKAKEKGLELPPVLEEGKKADANLNDSDVGKGLFDGW